MQALNLKTFEAKFATLAFLVFVPCDLEKEGINRRRNHDRVGEVEQLLCCEVDIPLVANPIGEVGQVRSIVGGERAVEVAAVGLYSVVVASPICGRSVCQQDIIPVHAILGELNVVLPALRGYRSCQLLVEDTNATLAVNGKARILG